MKDNKNQSNNDLFFPNKKAMIEIQFNWIFILIVGVLILLFFIGLTNWYKENEMRENANDVKFMLQTVMTGASINTRTASEIEIPRIEMEFFCDSDECGREGCSSEFSFSKTGISQDTSMDIVFSPKKIESDFMYVWSLDWNVPFKTTNFLYLSSPAIKYYLVYDKDDVTGKSKKLAEDVFSKMSENTFIKIKLIEDAEFVNVKYNNEYLVRLIRFYEGTNSPISASSSMLKEKKWDVVYITGDEISGTVQYSKWNEINEQNREMDANKKTDYVGLPSLIGAIFAEDYDHYLCNMKKAFTKFKTVNEIYSIRSKKLSNTYVGDNLCEFYYGASLQSHFAGIEISLSDLNSVNLGLLLTSIDGIESINIDTVLKSCPRIY